MSKKAFQAGNWFLKEDHKRDLIPQRPLFANSVMEDEIPPLPPLGPVPVQNKFSKFFTPGWDGGTLTSKHVIKFKKLITIFHDDCKESFKSQKNLNRSLVSSIYDEFLAYLEFKAINCSGLDDFQSFWRELMNESSSYRKELDDFIDIFSLRACVIYMLKLRLINSLLSHLGQTFESKYFYYPNSFFTTLFKKGSSTEINAHALESNIYSWYRPATQNGAYLDELKQILSSLTDAEIIKHLSIYSESILQEKAEYSHAISHINFGVFLNILVLGLPQWLAQSSGENFSKLKTPAGNEVVSALYQGDYLESFAASHWLAEHSAINDHSGLTLCPEFQNSNFYCGKYFSIYQQLSFLNYVVQLGERRNRPIVSFLCDIINSDTFNRFNNEGEQRSLLGKLDDDSRTYDRVVINLANFPKNNAQHHLINYIYAQESKLKSKGLLYVLSSKKLFVPSQKNKIDAMLEKFKIRAIFTLDEVKGKGEVPNYIYIFSKRNQSFHLDALESNLKESCFSFRFSGNLNSFSEYQDYSKQLLSFFNSHRGDIIPMYQKENEQGLRFEFFQDAIVDGRLINSTSKDSSKITFPQFFNNLMKNCHPLDFFFDIQNINFKEEDVFEDSLFDFGKTSENYSYVLIVDKRNPAQGTRIEIINPKALQAKSYEYGQTLCFYFGITPKWPNINLNAIEEFYHSPIGRQILDMSFGMDNRKIKASLNKLLLPKFFMASEAIPGPVLQGMKLLMLNENELMEVHPSQLKDKFQMVSLICQDLVKKYPGAVIALMASFKKNLKNCVDKMDPGPTSKVNFNNPLLKTPLLLSKTIPLYPNNQDIFIRFHGEASVNVLHNSLQRVKRKTQTEGEVVSQYLALTADGKEALAIYSDPEMLLFLEFILGNVVGAPISKILQGVCVPSLRDLKAILHNYQYLRDTFQQVYEQLEPVLEKIIASAITR